MKKSVDITKYDLKWQLVRVSVKGLLNDKMDYKLSIIDEYLVDGLYRERWERVYNWCEGLLRGLKNSADILTLNSLTHYMDSMNENKHLYVNKEVIFYLKVYNKDLLIKLWKDLFNTNKKWLTNGYLHKECNSFMDLLYNDYLKGIQVTPNYSYDALLKLRSESFLKTNTHKFFF